MPIVPNVSDITNKLLNIIQNESTLQRVWVHGKISNSHFLPVSFMLEDENNNQKIECVIFEENAYLFAGLQNGDNVLVRRTA